MPAVSILLGGVLAEAAAILALVLIVALVGPADAAAARAYAEHLGQWVGPIGGAVASLVAALLVARGAAGVELATGTAVGVVAASVDVAILAATRAPFQPLFIVSNAGRILAGGIGGWLAARGRQGRRLVVVRRIDAPIDVVFRTVADITQFSRALPHIVKVEFLSDTRLGVGTRFRETRLMKGKENVTELQVTEYVENDHVRLVADNHGIVWDSVFAVEPGGARTRLTMTMDTRTKRLMMKIMLVLISGMVRKAVEADMDMVRSYCEQSMNLQSAASRSAGPAPVVRRP
jgi:carbon monoxide dehydrogenase subunit G